MNPRLAVRAIIVEDGRLLLVNAYAGNLSDLWCAPGGGVEAGTDIPTNLVREVFEETGLEIAVGEFALVNEFHNPDTGFHQVELFFRARVVGGFLDPRWRDPERVVNRRRFFGAAELSGVRFKPDSLARLAFSPAGAPRYDPLERMVV